MELLLNLLWVMLAVPAFLIWRRERGSSRDGRPHSLLVLGCVLALLFPVISATDDLHPIRAEMEENNPSKRIVKQSPSARSAAWIHAGGAAARTAEVAAFGVENDVSEALSEYLAVLPEQSTAGTLGCRAPPLV